MIKNKSIKIIVILFSFILLMINGCGEKQEKKGNAPGMKCGAGKCGANMFDSNSALSKKKINILSQMRQNDSRKDCVRKAKTTKDTYNCIREIGGIKLTMKCGVGKCGTAKDRAKEPTMKCGTGKCGSSMEPKKPKKKAKMKCGAGKCGAQPIATH